MIDKALIAGACALADRLFTEDPVGIPATAMGLTEEELNEFKQKGSWTLIPETAWWKLNKEEEGAFEVLDAMKVESAVKWEGNTFKDVGSPSFIRVDFKNSSWIRYENRYALDIVRHILGFWIRAREAEDA